MNKPLRLLVTGHSGFVGQSLLAWLPTSRWAGCFELILPAGRPDIRVPAEVQAWVAQARPDCVLHLAAQSFVPESFRDPAGTLGVNVMGTLNLLQALQASGFDGRLVYVSSADIYGAVPAGELPVHEDRVPAPRNPYAVSKVAAEMLCRQWHFAHGLDVCIARPFNHVGPGQDERFVLSRFARLIARIALGRADAELVTGNIDVTRDFSDVRDVLDAYCELMLHGQPGEIYNVCSGAERRIGDLLHTMLDMAGVNAQVRVDPALLRPNEQIRMVGTYSKLNRHTDWQPRCRLEETLAAMIDWWRAKESET